MSFCLELEIEEFPRVGHGLIIPDVLYALAHEMSVKGVVGISLLKVSYRGIDFSSYHIKGICGEELDLLSSSSGSLTVYDFLPSILELLCELLEVYHFSFDKGVSEGFQCFLN